MTIVRVFVKIIGIPDEELLCETAVGCTASYFHATEYNLSLSLKSNA